MLEAIRTHLTGWVATVILGVIALALVISFGNMDSGVNPESVVAEVNGEKIFIADYRQTLDAQIQRYQEASGQELPPALKAQLGKTVLDGMINNRLLLQYVDESGYRISDSMVAASIRSIPAFNVDGEFSQQTYEALLLSQGLNPQAFERLRRRALETEQFQQSIAGTAFVTPTDFRRFLELEGEQRDVDYVIFEAAAFADQVEVTDEAIQTYYDENQFSFETPETLGVEFVELRLSDISAGIEIDEVDVRTYYEENADRFRSETELKSSHILISTDELSDEEALNKANEVVSRLNAGEDFAALATELSDDPGSAANGGELGWSTSGVFVSEFEDALFALEEGEVSLPVRTQFGYHVIRLDDLRPGAQKPFEEVREELRVELADVRAEDGFYERTERLDDLALESIDGLAVVAEELDLELNMVAEVTRGGSVGLPVSEALLNSLFSLEVLEDGQNTPVIEIEPGHVVVARVTEHRLPEVRPLAEVSDSIRAGLVRELAAEKAQAAAAAMLVQLQSGESFLAAAGNNGAEAQSQTGVLRGATDIPQSLQVAIFKAPRPGSAPSVDSVLLPEGAAVYQIRDVRAGKPEDISPEQRDGQKQQLAVLLGQSQIAAMIQQLRTDASIQVFDEVLQQPES